MGGAACTVIIKHLEDVFKDPVFYGFFDPHAKSMIDPILAKPYSQWTAEDGKTLFHLWDKVYREYLGQYIDE